MRVVNVSIHAGAVHFTIALDGFEECTPSDEREMETKVEDLIVYGECQAFQGY